MSQIRLNTWLFFEDDKCEKCDHIKVVKIGGSEATNLSSDTLQIIVSCNCDIAIFNEDWLNIEPHDRVHCVGFTVNDLLKMLGEVMGGFQ